jgi:hypothetical protein
MYGVDRVKLPTLLEELRQDGKLLYMVDLREKKREIYAW